ncbi:MAG: hypothetical protein IJD18_02615, partial [Clostridia bacterium]|nr:hypothetical protein [Clostridia bacterium]
IKNAFWADRTVGPFAVYFLNGILRSYQLPCWQISIYSRLAKRTICMPILLGQYCIFALFEKR